jgi:alpha,alpha-trehalose phosphorylase
VPVPPADPSGPPPEQAPGRAPLLRLPENQPTAGTGVARPAG